MRDIFENSKTWGSFNNWLANLPDEDLQYLCDITDKSSEELTDPVELDAFEQMCALAMFHSGWGGADMNNEELQDIFKELRVFLACESNVRKGYMTKSGVYSMVEGEDSAKLAMTPAGEESVRNMIKNTTKQ